jgi:hypothetical protein
MLLPSESTDRKQSIAIICFVVFMSIYVITAITCDYNVKKTAIEKGYEQDSNGHWVKNKEFNK